MTSRLLVLAAALSFASCNTMSSGTRSGNVVKPHLNPARAEDRAILDAEKDAADQPDDVAVQIKLGSAYLYHGWYDQAIAIYEEVLAKAPDNAEAWNYLGLANLRKGRADRARKDFEHAIAADPAYAEGHYNLAATYEAARDFPNAIKHYKIAITADRSLADRTLNPHARESALLSVAVLSLYKDATGAMTLDPRVPEPPTSTK